MLGLDGVSVCYGAIEVVQPLSLEIGAGEFFTLLGPSGCGKTTLLRAIAGLVPVASGRIRIAGEDVTDRPAEKRDVGIVFQNYALFPHMTVRDNVAFGLRVARQPKAAIARAVDTMLETTGIAALHDRKPAALSGGQQQRVAVARSLVTGPRVLLFDEPLSNLDANIRAGMRREIRALQRRLGFTAVFVTHDREEALSLSDRLLVLNAGKVEQIGSGRALYDHPRTPFVCQFVGGANHPGPALARRLGLAGDGPVCLRPEHLRIVPGDTPGAVAATVRDVEYGGATTRIVVAVGPDSLQLLAFSGSVSDLVPGQTVHVRIDRDRMTAGKTPA